MLRLFLPLLLSLSLFFLFYLPSFLPQTYLLHPQTACSAEPGAWSWRLLPCVLLLPLVCDKRRVDEMSESVRQKQWCNEPTCMLG